MLRVTLLQVELRAFCSKHSEFQDITTQQPRGLLPVTVGCDASVTQHLPETLVVNEPHKLRLGCKNGDKNMVHVKTTDTNSDKLGNIEIPMEQSRADSGHQSECGDARHLISMETLGRNVNGDINSSDCLDFVQILKKVIGR